MRPGQQATLSAFLAAAIGATVSAVLLVDGVGMMASAQAQGGDDRKRREHERRSSPPPSHQPQRMQQQQPLPSRPTQLQGQQPAERPVQRFQRPPHRPVVTNPGPELKKEGLRHYPPSVEPGGAAPPKAMAPPTFQKPPAVASPPSGPTGPTGPAKAVPLARPAVVPHGPGPRRFEEVRKGRLERLEDGGRRKVIEEPGKRFIVREGNRAIIRHDETERFLRRPGAYSEHRPDGHVQTSYVRRDGVRIVREVDSHGRLLRCFRRDHDGREHNIIDNRRFYRNVAIGVGIGALGIIALSMPPPHVTIPYDEYVVDYDRASDDDLYETLDAPPIETLDRPYSLEEIRATYALRARMRRIDLDTITFEFGAWEVSPDQYDKLERVARAILRVLRDNPDAVFLIEGHTDAVGSDDDNLSLSDRRAGSVAEILSETFEVPPENLVTQGYGEQYLKVDTQEPDPRNRRVSIINISPLMAER